MDYFRVVKVLLDEFDDIPTLHEVTPVREVKVSKFIPFNTLEGMNDIFMYKSSYIPPYKMLDNTVECANPVNKNALSAAVLVHKLDNYRRVPNKFVVMPKITTLLDLILKGGDSNAAVLSIKSPSGEQ